jgi:MtrB/PioB family decaheme-associated outer membrane protein
MNKKLISILISGLFISAPALAQSDDAFKLTGSIGIGGLGTSTSSNGDKAKLEEYRDLSNGVIETIDIKGRGGKSWVDLFAENIGRDDMYVNLRGGIYDTFKARVYSDWLKHNFVDNARTPFSGAGTDTQRAVFPQPNPATWYTTDIGYTRKDTGGYFEWQALNPWYFRAEANEVKSQGSKLGAAALGTSPGNGYADLSLPVQYKTQNFVAEFGYSSKTLHVAVNYTASKFNNDYESMTWSNPFFGNLPDTTYLPPDNKFQKIGINATLRQLPLDSTLAARYTWSETKSDVGISATALNGTGATAYQTTLPDEDTFHGKVETTTFTLALASSPLKNLDTRLYYNYNERKNKSVAVEFGGDVPNNPLPTGLGCATAPGKTAGSTVPGPCEGEVLNFKKNNFGLDAYWRVAKGNRLGFGYDYLDNTFNREDYSGAKTNTFFAEYKNTMLENLSARLKYTYAQRRSDFLLANSGVDANDPAYLARFVGRFDEANLDQNKLKLTVDWSPAPMVDVAIEGIYKENKYKDYTLGRNKDKREELYAALSFGNPQKVRMTLFGDIENVKYDSTHRYVGASPCSLTGATATGPNCYDPATPPPANGSAYNWTATNKDQNTVVGVGVDWPAMSRLLVKASFMYYKTDGTADMASQNNFGNPLPIGAYDSSKKTSLNLKGIYDFNKNFAVTVGYAYEKYEYSDDRFNGYQYTIPFPGVATNTGQTYLNGWNAYTPYTANIFYGLVSYKFN